MSNESEFAVVLSTSPALDGKNILRYLGIVAGEVFTAAGPAEPALEQARSAALAAMTAKAAAGGANAVIGVRLEYQAPGDGSGRLIIAAYGTAVLAGGLEQPPGFDAPPQFFIMLREVEKGPFTEAQLRDLLASGHITAQTLCRLETESVWRILAKTIKLPPPAA
jgi:uncharacterized protein YbjQ (UPF0145 family)